MNGAIKKRAANDFAIFFGEIKSGYSNVDMKLAGEKLKQLGKDVRKEYRQIAYLNKQEIVKQREKKKQLEKELKKRRKNFMRKRGFSLILKKKK